tara:strand:- start:5860 stop:7761 length:1902 start_codon:yes stop_codon:yes gene_type:complete
MKTLRPIIKKSLMTDSVLDKSYRPVKIDDKVTGLLVKENKVGTNQNPTEPEDIANKSYVDSQLYEVQSLDGLSDVSYANGDLTIDGLDKIVTSGDLDFLVAGGDISFKANEYGSGFDGGVNFNVTSNKVSMYRNLLGGAMKGIEFNVGITAHSIESTAGTDLKIQGDADLEFTQKDTAKKIDFYRLDTSQGDVRLSLVNGWSALINVLDWINSTSGASGDDVYALIRGQLKIEDDTGADKTLLLRLDADQLKSVTFTNYNSTVAGTLLGTSSNHGYITGEKIMVEGTTNYNGSYVITKVNAHNFYFTKAYVSDQSGKTYRSTSEVLNRHYGTFNVDKVGDIFTRGNKIEFVDSTQTEISCQGDLVIDADGGNIALKDGGVTKVQFNGASMTIGSTHLMDQNMQYDGDDVINFDSNGVVEFPGYVHLPQKASAGTDRSNAGQIWVKNNATTDLYFTNDDGNDIQITSGSSLAGGGGGSTKWYWNHTSRWYTRYNNWYFPSSSYGTTTVNWSYTLSSASLPTSWLDSVNPCIVIPEDLTINDWGVYGNFTGSETYEVALMKGTPSYGSAGNTTLTQLGTTQSQVAVGGVYYRIEETGLSVSLSKGDIIIPCLRRSTTNTSSYRFFEFGLNINGTV